MKEKPLPFDLPAEIHVLSTLMGFFVSDPHKLHQDTLGGEAIGRHNKLRACHCIGLLIFGF